MIPLFDDLPEDLSQCVQELQAIDGWPIDWGKDSQLVLDLDTLYPEVDFPKMAIEFRVWLLDHKSRKKTEYRRRFRRWVRNDHEWRLEKRSRKYRGHRQAETGGFGETVESREDW